MFNTLISKVAIASAAAAVSVAVVDLAPAEAISFNLSGSIGAASSFSYTADGINLDVTSNIGLVNRSGTGLGVLSGRFDSPQIDGLGPNETLFLNFDHVVSLISATFTRVGLDDDFTLSVDGDQLVAADIPADFLAEIFDVGVGTFSFTSFSPDNQGSVFGFGIQRKNDGYRLKHVEVAKVDVAQDVPEPASMMALLALGAAGAGILKRNEVNA